MTQAELLLERKRDYIDYNRKHFTKYGKILPKFNEEEGESKKWWLKQSRDSFPIPASTNSAIELSLKKRLGSKDFEPMLLADYSTEPAPADPFKSVHVPQPKKPTALDDCAPKPNQILYEEPTEEAAFEGPTNMEEQAEIYKR
jgi:hypothetical protein